MTESAPAAWWLPTLSLPAQVELTACRQAAARMSRDELVIHLDAVLEQCFQQRAVIRSATQHIAALESRGGAQVEDRHREWARELLAS